MHFIYGGAYQGKKDWAVSNFALREEEIFECGENAEPDWSKRCITHLERYVFYCTKNNRVPELGNIAADAVLIADDISGGIVPMDPTERIWREECGRLNARIAKTAETVTRIFCGLPQSLK